MMMRFVQASILWVGKPTTPQRISAGATTLVSPYTAGLIEGDSATLAAGGSFSLTVTNPLLQADSLVYVTNVDDTYSASATNNRCEKRHFLRHLYIKTIILPRQARVNIGKSTQNQYVFLRFRSRAYRDGLTVAGLAYPEAPRPTLFYYAEVSAGQFTLTVQNADDFDAAATSLGYTWKVSWVAFI
jgi:hypothetical protein